MEAKPVNGLLIVIVGPTASGKTSLAVTLAGRHGGEIICADSRTVYVGMDIGTAKPSREERSLVPHWGLDLVRPGERFTVADFKAYADNKISEIRARGNVPFLVGGSGLYVDSVLFNYQFGRASSGVDRQLLEQKELNELIDYCVKNNIKLPENRKNKRYVIRAIEQNGVNHKRNKEPRDGSIIVGITTEKNTHATQIIKRSEQLFNDGVVNEAITLGKKYGWDSEAMTGNVYTLIKKYIDGEMTLSQVKERNVIADRQLAKKQMTWLRRNEYIQWYSRSDAEHYLSQLLATKDKT